jgi:hypothetical protein
MLSSLMKPLARAFADALVDHHNALARSEGAKVGSVTNQDVSRWCLTYSELCRQAGRGIARGAGPYLGEVHEWCREKRWPPINALVVTKKTGRPGMRYPGKNWNQEVRDCISFRQYKKP